MRSHYYAPPKDRCDLCGRLLYGTDRYKVRLYLRAKPLDKTVFRELVVCKECLYKIKRDTELRRLFVIRYRRMRDLASLF